MATVTVECGTLPIQWLTVHNVDWITCEGGEALLGISTDHPWGNVRVYLHFQDVAILESCGGRRNIIIRKRRD